MKKSLSNNNTRKDESRQEQTRRKFHFCLQIKYIPLRINTKMFSEQEFAFLVIEKPTIYIGRLIACRDTKTAGIYSLNKVHEQIPVFKPLPVNFGYLPK